VIDDGLSFITSVPDSLICCEQRPPSRSDKRQPFIIWCTANKVIQMPFDLNASLHKDSEDTFVIAMVLVEIAG
jgi:hypothetical protein